MTPLSGALLVLAAKALLITLILAPLISTMTQLEVYATAFVTLIVKLVARRRRKKAR